ncbi:hypothetical protein DIKCMJMK_01479 [Shewanella oneidensis]|uniref:Inovirus Gp2 family protein n=2 Tax=Shewanella oneidensis TaxID=70863 RepID=Q8EJS8_SHEON|nr:protein of unknown function DUF3296 [Shewanella oneidensis MR-1]MEE2027620.1 hypothetical protein [Shewanella oneidensis]
MLTNAGSKSRLTSRKMQSTHLQYYGRSRFTPLYNPHYEQVIYNISALRFPLEDFLYQETLFKVMSFEHGISSSIMSAAIDQLLTALSHYSKILLVRFDLRVYTETPNNSLISKYRKTLLRFLDKKYQSKAWLFWVREQTPRSDKAHYHCFILLNGHKAKSGWGAFQQVQKACYMHPDTSAWLPESASYKIERNGLKGVESAIHRISYLAKHYSKELTPNKIKRFQTSTSRS